LSIYCKLLFSLLIKKKHYDKLILESGEIFMEQNQKLLKVVGIYLCYFLYSKLAAFFAQTITLMNGKAMYLIFDIFFLGFICFLYFKNLKKDFQTLKEKYNWKKILKIIFFYIGGTLLISILLSFIRELFFPDVIMDANTQSIQDLAKISPIYAIFKAMIFGGVAEEILYRESLSEIVENNVLFILISSILYTILPFVFNAGNITIMELLAYFLPSLWISYLYVKNERNILVVMIMKFVYNLIPLAILVSDLLK